ncbi:hypothetical protein H0H92_000901 [Tricholoma furcatifolium]|nr:hypothetical protein H0H92_000901 [Tricholoma furcatifolium]
MVSIEGPVRTRSSPTLTSTALEIPRYVIPTEVIKTVGYYTLSLRDVLSISLTCRRARAALLPRLYSIVELATNRQCKIALEGFMRYPKLARHIRSLTVRPNNVERSSSNDYLDEEYVAGVIATMACHMPLLRSFLWDGLEMPNDKLWIALRQFCPLLKSVGTSVGYLPIRNTDSLFDFRDLISFTLSVKSDSLEWLLDERPKTEKLPRRCWEMLLEHCPNLEELTIGGSAPSPRIFNTRHVTAGRWPRLRKLTLGDMQLQPAADHDGKGSPRFTLSQFLIMHPRLQEVAFLQPGANGFPNYLSLPKDFSAALRRSPQLRSFALTKVYKSSDEDMGHTALRIARDNPHIQQFTLRYTQESWLTHSTGRVKHFGRYEKLSSLDGLPVGLLSREWGVKSFGKTYSRHYVQQLLESSSKTRRTSTSSHVSWSSSERSRSPRPTSVLSFHFPTK